MQAIIKYFFIFSGTTFMVKKLLNISPRPVLRIVEVLCSFILAAISVSTSRIQIGTILITAIFLSVEISIFYHQHLSVSLVAGIISIGLAYLAYALASVAVAPVFILLLYLRLSENTIAILGNVSCGLIQLVLVRLPFKFSRLKNGMPYLQQNKTGWFGSALSLFMLLAISILILNPQQSRLVALYDVIVAESGFILILWWRQNILDRYNERIHRKQLEDARNEAEQMAAERESLKRDNQDLAKLIHTDSKMVSAVGASAAELLQEAEFRDNFKKQRANDLISFVETYSRERSAVLFNYNNHAKQLPQTGLAGVDAMIAQMQRAAFLEGIDFDFNFAGTIKAFVPAVVNEVDLAKLIGDLAQNAVIATRGRKTKQIFVFFSATELFNIDILDSGDLFPAEVITKLGCEQITTHANSGGSGYGMVTVFEICRKHGASFVLEETPEKVFSKKVTICFDGLMQLRIHTSREEVLATKNIRQDVIWT